MKHTFLPLVILFAACSQPERQIITEIVYQTDTVFIERESDSELFPWHLTCADSAETQFEINQCAGKCYQTADSTTQDLYNQMLLKLDGKIMAFKSTSTPIFKEQKLVLGEIHSYFEKIRELSSRYQALEFENGTMAPLIMVTTKTWIAEFESKLMRSFSVNILKG